MPKNIQPPIRGTREWAVANINCCTGCAHDCLYCYARYDAVVKRGTSTSQEWRNCKVRQNDVDQVQALYPGQVMFPTNHDILPENLQACTTVIRNLLIAGNRVLVVSKPHLQCISELCDLFVDYTEKLLFRFTLTARDNELLSFWEPGAPSYEERKACLCHAYSKGYQTSVSVEPMLDTDDVVAMVHELLPCVSHSIWLGKMNSITRRVNIDSALIQEHVERIRVGQEDSIVQRIYTTLCNEPLVRWKESIKSVVGLELPTEPGLDR